MSSTVSIYMQGLSKFHSMCLTRYRALWIHKRPQSSSFMMYCFESFEISKDIPCSLAHTWHDLSRPSLQLIRMIARCSYNVTRMNKESHGRSIHLVCFFKKTSLKWRQCQDMCVSNDFRVRQFVCLSSKNSEENEHRCGGLKNLCNKKLKI